MVSTPRQNIDLYVLGLLCLSLGANVLLGIRVLRSGPAGPIQFRQPNGWIALAEGTPVPVLVGRSADGRPRRIDFALDHRQTVLYVYANTCIWCDRNADSLAALVAQRRENYRFIALNISPEQSD